LSSIVYHCGHMVCARCYGRAAFNGRRQIR
jgi:hypothetical protein